MAQTKMLYTEEGYKVLTDELNYLKTVRREEIKEAIAVAKGFGDLSENAEYDEARNEQAKTEARIKELEELVANAVIVDETFAIAANQGTLNDKTITWNSDNFVFTGKQANSTSAIRTSDTDHYRVYAGSSFSITGNNGQKITKVVITVTESKYAEVLVNSISSNGITATVNGTTVTLVVDAGSIDTINFSATAQFRVKQFVISYK